MSMTRSFGPAGRRALIAVLALAVVAFVMVACKSEPESKPDGDRRPVPSQTELLATAQHMLRMDDYRQFEKAEFRLIALRVWRSQDIEIAGWLAQLYVAWTEQLKSEISFLRLKSTAAKFAENEDDRKAMELLVDYRLAKLTEVEENARLLCNTLRTYYPQHYLSHRVMADYFRVMGDWEKMEPHLAIVEQLNPDSVGLQFLKGAVLAQFKQDYIHAVDNYDAALKKDPLFIKALYFKGLAYKKMGRDAVAREIMEDVLQKSPSHPGARAFLAADKYIELLTADAKQKLAGVNKDLVVQMTQPHLIYWVANWYVGRPQLLFRIGGATERDTDIKVKITLVLNDDVVLQTYEQTATVQANTFQTFTQNFLTPILERGDSVDVIIQLTARGAGDTEGDFVLVSTRKAHLPDPPSDAAPAKAAPAAE